MSKYGFWEFLAGFQNGLLQNIPVVQLPEGSMTVFLSASNYVSVISHYIPIDTFMVCLSGLFVLWIAFAIVSILLQLF